MRSSLLTRYLQYPIVLTLLFCAWSRSQAQLEFSVINYTAKQGLPQNSIKGLTFDGHGFLWLATEGGIARFDGQQFKIMSAEDHPDLRKQRYIATLKCSDGDIVFMDMIKGFYTLSNDRFFTMQEPDPDHQKFVAIIGSPPDAQFLVKDSFFLEELNSMPDIPQINIVLLPFDSSKIIIVGKRIVQVDLARRERKVIDPQRQAKDIYTKLNNDILKINSTGEISVWNKSEMAFKSCVILDHKNKIWSQTFEDYDFRVNQPYDILVFHNQEKMYRLVKGENDTTFIVLPFINQLPAECNVTALAYHQSTGTLVLGTDARGIFVYREKAFTTFTQHTYEFTRENAFYAQCLLDSNTLLTGNGLMIDINSLQIKGLFPKKMHDIHLAMDRHDNIFYFWHNNAYRYHLPTKTEFRIQNKVETHVQALRLIGDEMWVGTSTGAGRIINDSIHFEFEIPFISEHHGIKSINIDPEGDLWLGSDFNLYHIDKLTKQVDSFPELKNTDVRTIDMVRGKPFIGTYGAGYFIYDHGSMVHMPDGRNHELTNTHAFIDDQEGHVWIPTNRGLYQTHLDAIETYLADQSKPLDYYCYLEESGIINAEFNGGCSPSHIRFPDGRFSLPSLEGLVIFNPSATHHPFSADSVVIEYVEVDDIRYRPENLPNIPSDHSKISIYFSGAWWYGPNNQFIYWRIDEAGNTNTLCNTGQTMLSIGHLSPGNHTLVMSLRNGFGPEDFVLSRLRLHVEKPWYAKGWAIVAFSIGIVLLTWSLVVSYSWTIRRRNIELQKKVDEQTKELLTSNIHLEENVNKLATSEINLRKNIRVRDRLISIITHDILTPLRFISQISRLGAEEKPSERGLANRALADVQNATHKLFHSTQNLLHWVTYHQENFTPTSVNCSPFAIVEQLMEDFSEMSRFQDNTLINEVSEDDVILTDPRILTIILHNLLSNAIKYTQHGTIRVNSRIEQNWFVLEVIDNGRGMSPEQIEAVRTGTLQRGEISDDAITAGNGIGLSLVADLMEALHGRWAIESPGEEGVRVSLYISLEQLPDH